MPKVVLKEKKAILTKEPTTEKLSWIKVKGAIPSKWLPYPKGLEIYYRPYTHGDLLLFNQTNPDGSPVMDAVQRIEFVMKGIDVGGAPFDKWSISYRDFLFVSLLRRLSTFDTNQFVMAYKCSVCGGENQAIFSLEQVDIMDVEVPALPVVYTTTEGEVLHFSLLTVGGYMRLLKEGNLKDELAILSEMLVNFQDREKAYKILYDARGKGGQDIEALIEINTMLLTGIKPLEHKCQFCLKFNEEEEQKEKSTPGYSAYFRDPTNYLSFYDPEVVVFPFRQPDDTFRNRIRFGLQGNR